MAERFSIYAGEPLARLLDHAGGENRSGRINDAVGRYLAIVDDELRRLRFSRAEWFVMLDANNGATIPGTGDQVAWRTTWANVADAPEVGEKWGVDHADLAARMRDLNLAARAAVAEVVERFWERPQIPADDALRESGVILAGDHAQEQR